MFKVIVDKILRVFSITYSCVAPNFSSNKKKVQNASRSPYITQTT